MSETQNIHVDILMVGAGPGDLLCDCLYARSKASE